MQKPTTAPPRPPTADPILSTDELDAFADIENLVSDFNIEDDDGLDFGDLADCVAVFEDTPRVPSPAVAPAVPPTLKRQPSDTPPPVPATLPRRPLPDELPADDDDDDLPVLDNLDDLSVLTAIADEFAAPTPVFQPPLPSFSRQPARPAPRGPRGPPARRAHSAVYTRRAVPAPLPQTRSAPPVPVAARRPPVVAQRPPVVAQRPPSRRPATSTSTANTSSNDVPASWLASDPPPGAPADLDGADDLRRYTFYHGQITSSDAVSRLARATPGTFLVRLSSREGCFVISWMKTREQIIHSLLTRNAAGQWTMSDQQHQWPTVVRCNGRINVHVVLVQIAVVLAYRKNMHTPLPAPSVRQPGVFPVFFTVHLCRMLLRWVLATHQ